MNFDIAIDLINALAALVAAVIGLRIIFTYPVRHSGAMPAR